MPTDLYDQAARYGVSFTGTLVDHTYHDQVSYDRPYTLADLAQAKGRITRLRLLSDPGYPYWDISYCHGTLPDGTTVPINVSGSAQITKRNPMAGLLEWAKSEGVYAKSLGLLDRSNWSTQS